MSLLDLNMVSMVLEDLNKEMAYQASEMSELPIEQMPKYLKLTSDGDDYSIFLFERLLWSSVEQERFEQLSPEKEIELNTREHFEGFVREIVQFEIDMLCCINLIPENNE